MRSLAPICFKNHFILKTKFILCFQNKVFFLDAGKVNEGKVKQGRCTFLMALAAGFVFWHRPWRASVSSGHDRTASGE
jgi:hypothetical protein